MRGFLLGAIVGAAAMWLWGDKMRAQVSERVDALVDQVLGVLDAVDDRLEALRHRVDAMSSAPERAAERRERADVSAMGGSA
jgi:hypothetical protein